MHCAHDADAARADTWWVLGEGSSVVKGLSERRNRLLASGGGLAWEGVLSEASLGPRGTMVLFLKQVHLQNVGAVAICS